MDTKIFKDSELIDHGLLDDVIWLDANWMFLSLVFGILLLLWLLFSPTWSGSNNIQEKLHNPQWLGYVAVFVYSTHQFEEHAYDIFGRRYMFVPMFNAGTGSKLGLQMLPRPTLYINIGYIWFAFNFWAYMSKRKNGYYSCTFAWGMAIINGIFGHIVPIIIETGEYKYVPGAIQSIFLMVPMGLYVLLNVFTKHHGIFNGFVFPLIFGIVLHIVGLIIPASTFTWIPEDIKWPLFISMTTVLPILLMMPLLEKNLQLKPWQAGETLLDGSNNPKIH